MRRESCATIAGFALGPLLLIATGAASGIGAWLLDDGLYWLAAAGLGTLKPFDRSAVPGAFKSPIEWRIDLPADKADATTVWEEMRGCKTAAAPRARSTSLVR